MKHRKGKNWNYEEINPIELIKQIWPKVTDKELSFIEYDPNLRKGQYSIVRQQSHDGTHYFTWLMFQKALLLILTKQSCHKPSMEKYSEINDVKYKIGPIRLSSVYGKVNVQMGEIHGERQRFRMPVISELIGVKMAEEMGL